MTIDTFLNHEKDIFELKENLLNLTRENLTTNRLAEYVINSFNRYKE